MKTRNLLKIFSWEKISFGVFGPKKAKSGSKMKFFKFYENSMLGIFLIFLHEFTVAIALQLTQMIF